MAKRQRSPKRAIHHRSGSPSGTLMEEPPAHEKPRPAPRRPGHQARVDDEHLASSGAAAGLIIQVQPARWTHRLESSSPELKERPSSRPAERTRSLWNVDSLGSLFAFFGPLLSAMVGCQALVVILLGQLLPNPSWLALSALFAAMLALDHLAIRPLIGRHHRDFLPRLYAQLIASALPAVALLLVRHLS